MSEEDRRQAADYIATLAVQLARSARKADFHVLAYLFEMAAAEATQLAGADLSAGDVKETRAPCS
jgi:predicted TIM-barrel enzyme